MEGYVETPSSEKPKDDNILEAAVVKGNGTEDSVASRRKILVAAVLAIVVAVVVGVVLGTRADTENTLPPSTTDPPTDPGAETLQPTEDGVVDISTLPLDTVVADVPETLCRDTCT